MKVIFYTRVSTEDQSHEPQLHELRVHAERNGWEVVRVYSDTASGARAKRPQLDAMLAGLAGSGVGAIVAVKLDRLGRSTLNMAQLIESLDRQGVGIICPSQGIDTRHSSPIGRLQVAMLSTIAAFERDLIRERTVAGLRVAKARGVKLGRPSGALRQDWQERLAAWRAEVPRRSLRALAADLGGVSVSFAWKLAKGVQPAVPPCPSGPVTQGA